MTTRVKRAAFWQSVIEETGRSDHHGGRIESRNAGPVTSKATDAVQHMDETRAKRKAGRHGEARPYLVTASGRATIAGAGRENRVERSYSLTAWDGRIVYDASKPFRTGNVVMSRADCIRVRAIASIFATAILFGAAVPLDAANVLISNLSDVNFGTANSSGADQTMAQSVCTYSGLLGGTYSVTAVGSGTGGAFTLAGPSSVPLSYEVQWAASAGQTAGTRLTAGNALTGQSANALNCVLGLVTDASLILVLRASAVSVATAGNYSGTLSIILAPN